MNGLDPDEARTYSLELSFALLDGLSFTIHAFVRFSHCGFKGSLPNRGGRFLVSSHPPNQTIRLTPIVAVVNLTVTRISLPMLLALLRLSDSFPPRFLSPLSPPLVRPNLSLLHAPSVSRRVPWP
jgi:hypothetical protein